MASINNFENVKFVANELSKAAWVAIKSMLDSLTDEEIEKIPSLLNNPIAKEAAEKYGICDAIQNYEAKKYTNVYWLGGCLFKGSTQTYNDTE